MAVDEISTSPKREPVMRVYRCTWIPEYVRAKKTARSKNCSPSTPKLLKLAFACIHPFCREGNEGSKEIRISLHVRSARTCDACMHFIYDKAQSRNPPRPAIIIKLHATVGGRSDPSDRGDSENRCPEGSWFTLALLESHVRMLVVKFSSPTSLSFATSPPLFSLQRIIEK